MLDSRRILSVLATAAILALVTGCSSGGNAKSVNSSNSSSPGHVKSANSGGTLADLRAKVLATIPPGAAPNPGGDSIAANTVSSFTDQQASYGRLGWIGGWTNEKHASNNWTIAVIVDQFPDNAKAALACHTYETTRRSDDPNARPITIRQPPGAVGFADSTGIETGTEIDYAVGPYCVNVTAGANEPSASWAAILAEREYRALS